MFRSQVLIWAFPSKTLLLLRDSHLPAFSQCAGLGCRAARCTTDRKYQQISGKSSLSMETVCCSTLLSSRSSDCETRRLKGVLNGNVLSSCHHHAHISTKTSLTIRTFPQHWRTLQGLSWVSHCFTRNHQFTLLQKQLHHRLCYSVSRVSLLGPKAWTLKWFHWKQPPSHQLNPIRSIHQVAPHEAEAWRGCLTLQNESRCRQLLVPHWKLYDVDGVRKGTSPTRGQNQDKWASILVSLCSVEGEPAFLFTLRSRTLKGQHKGDVSFAGGKSDPSDGDVVATALREAREELGIDVMREKVWGVMKPLRETSGMMIAPVLANLGPVEELTFRPNPEEVEEIFTLPVSHLCSPQNRGYTNFRTGGAFGYRLPVFCNGKHRVWGLTAVALDQTLTLVVPPEHLKTT